MWRRKGFRSFRRPRFEMRNNRCVKCLSEFAADYKSNVCKNCESEKEFGFPQLSETVILLKNTKDENRMTRAEINEVKRNRCVRTGEGRWQAGRMGDNGKVQEREIKYSG